MTTSLTRAAGLCALLATTCLVSPSLLHAATPIAAPPVEQSVDLTDLSIGGEATAAWP